MGDDDLSPATGSPPPRAVTCRVSARVVRLVTTWMIGGVLVVAATGCGGDADTNVTPLADAATTASTSAAQDGASSDRPTTTSAPTKKPSSSIDPAESGDSRDSGDSTVTPTSTPSAERFADGSVVSAGGYEAKTPAVARGLLLEPEWTDEQQEAADVIHQYLDAMIMTVTDKKPDKKIPTSMTDLERPDLNTAGLVQLDTQNLVRGMTKTGGYWVDPDNSESAFWVSDMAEITQGRMQIGLCTYNEFEKRDLQDGRVINDDAGTSYWDGQLAPTKPDWRIVSLLHQGTKKGRVGCAAS